MIKRKGRYTFEFTEMPHITSFASVAGKTESEGPLGTKFDKVIYDSHALQDTFEEAEVALQKEAVSLAIEKAHIKAEDVDMIFSGDLLNQCTVSAFAAQSFFIPFLGQYGACSTSAQTLIMSGIAVSSGAADTALAVTSSHFCSAERQFRFPLEYGAVRPTTSQRTVTGSGAFIVNRRPDKKSPKLRSALVGKLIDKGVSDANNMGAAMAPAAADTLKCFFEDTNTNPLDFDRIYTGDLGETGSKLLVKLLQDSGFDISPNHEDCGMIIYDLNKQDVYSGGSGCGCGACVLASYILPELESGRLNRVLYIATGALLSSTTASQGASIPSVAHLAELVSHSYR